MTRQQSFQDLMNQQSGLNKYANPNSLANTALQGISITPYQPKVTTPVFQPFAGPTVVGSGTKPLFAGSGGGTTQRTVYTGSASAQPTPIAQPTATTTAPKPKPTTQTGTTRTATTTTAPVNPNNLTAAQLAAGYSTIEGAYDPVTGKLKSAPAVPGTAASLAGINYQNPEDLALQAEQDRIDSYYKEQFNQTIDPTKTYNDTLNTYQSQIDALNNIYNDMLVRSRTTNAPTYNRRLGSAASLAVNQGLVGSNVGESNIQEVERQNQEEQTLAEAAINERRNQEIASIMGQVRKSSEDAINAQREAKAQGAEKYLDALKSAPQRRRDNAKNAVKSLLMAGIAIDELSDEDVKKLEKDLKMTKGELESIYSDIEMESVAAQAEAEKAQAELEYKQAQTANTIAETGQIGKMTPYQAAQIGISQAQLKIAQDRAAREKKDEVKTYDAETIPVLVKNELAADLIQNQSAKKKEKKSLEDFFSAYPEVNTEYLFDLYTQYVN